MNAFQRHAARTRASAVVELAILLPVYLLIIFAMLYIGQLTLYKQRQHFGGEYAMDLRGDQSEAAAVRGPVTSQFYATSPGALTVVESGPAPAEIPESGEIRGVFNEMCTPVYSTTAHGQYVFSGGQLRFVVTTGQSRTLQADGQYVMRYRLLDDNIPELLTDVVQGWQQHNIVDLTYTYRPDYISVGPWPIDAGDLATHFRSTVRGAKDRAAGSPPSGSNHAIDAVTGSGWMTNSGRLPDYPGFSGDQPFWQPD